MNTNIFLTVCEKVRVLIRRYKFNDDQVQLTQTLIKDNTTEIRPYPVVHFNNNHSKCT